MPNLSDLALSLNSISVTSTLTMLNAVRENIEYRTFQTPVISDVTSFVTVIIDSYGKIMKKSWVQSSTF